MKRTFTSLLTAFIATIALNAQTHYSNNFDGAQPAPGWVMFDNGIGTVNNWALYSDPHYSAPYSAGIKYEAVGSGQLAEDYFATPLIDLTTATNPRLSFMARQGYATDYGSTYHVLVSTTTQNEISAYTEVASWTEATLGGTEFEIKLVDLSAYAGQQIYIAFMMSNNNGDYFIIDDVIVEEAIENNVELLEAPIKRYLILDEEVALNFVLRNLGSNPVTSLDLSWNDGTDHVNTLTGLNIAPGELVTFTHPDLIGYADVGQHDIAVSISTVNGGADSNPDDNSTSAVVNVISQDGGKKILFEEGTGTWCGYCPRGMVAMEYMQETYPDKFIGVAVHNGDPMTNTEYDTNAAFQGYPGMNVDRTAMGAEVSNSSMESYITSFDTATPVAISGTATLDGRDVTINTSATFYTDFTSADFRIGVIIVEDGVTGTTAGYAQTNYYAGGQIGPMGGYENLPNTVPASQMVYDHVGRALLGGYHGQEGSVPAVITDGQTVAYTFNYTVPESYNIQNVHGVVVLIDQTTGQIVNANTVEIGTLGVNDIQVDKNAFAVYPNPASSLVNVNLADAGKYQVSIYNTAGQKVASHQVDAAAKSSVSLPVSNLKPGVYIITAATNGKSFSKKLIIK